MLITFVDIIDRIVDLKSSLCVFLDNQVSWRISDTHK